MSEIEHIPPLPRVQELLRQYATAYDHHQQIDSTETEQAWRRAADLLDTALLVLPGRFELGQLVATPGALATLERGQHLPVEFLLRHKQGDWGDLDPHDHQINEDALDRRGRLVSIYRTRDNNPLWVITDAGWDCTTILLPEEY